MVINIVHQLRPSSSSFLDFFFFGFSSSVDASFFSSFEGVAALVEFLFLAANSCFMKLA